MSAALVRKSLAIVDPSLDGQERKQKKYKKILDFVPDNKRIIKKIYTPGSKTKKVEVLQRTNKLTIVEARKKVKSKEEILKVNLQKLEAIKKICTIDLDKDITEQILARGRSRRPVPKPQNKKKDTKSVFTEEDFKKFEAEYFDE